jgi:2-polyprenyl-3-methyl-5-hydroxy-6-metoxy-1,4-benzoquinol methylase
MDTDTEEYCGFLQKKYRPGRAVYLSKLIYPKYIKELVPGVVCDFGCGMGAFLEYCRDRHIPACGIDANPYMVQSCRAKGLNVEVDDITSPRTITGPIHNIICDNVLEHLSMGGIRTFFCNARRLLGKGGVLLVIVPNRKGFESDPTHATFLDGSVVAPLAKEQGFIITNEYQFPLRSAFLGSRYIFNMTVLRLVV